MDTSRSSSWTATVHLYSGRPDPRWEVPGGVGEQLSALWAKSRPPGESPAPPPPLGYRGVTLSAPDGTEWTAYRGVITKKFDGGVERRADEEGLWERTLLESAPAGMLPPLESWGFRR